MSTSIAQPSPQKGYRLLAFDGGGLKAISQALIIRDMLQRLKRIASSPVLQGFVTTLYDLILAIMCGILRMIGDELVEEGLKGSKWKVKKMVAKYCEGGAERKMLWDEDQCKTFVCAGPAHNATHPRLFRNYRSRTNASLDCMIWQAALATTAMPDFFLPIYIGPELIGESIRER
ncbi:hypothetical protein DL96DRAFT_1715400 [Flagelloscypha sp. PMI_526]|nr:hypothetical protein DL96DRAFT_1715400 [Flagelloscypha sp. PMI_526]